MRQLDVSPLPSMEQADGTVVASRPHDGFVEDSVVVALLTSAGPQDRRQYRPEFGLAASALDYAGWPSAEPMAGWPARAV